MGTWLKQFIEFLRTPGPHYRNVEELDRVPNPNRLLDAVLIIEQSRCLGIYIVRRGKSTHGSSRRLTLMHCREGPIPELSWIDGNTLFVEGYWEATSQEGDSEFVGNDKRTATIKIQ